jgi:serine/threonine-protein kinase
MSAPDADPEDLFAEATAEPSRGRRGPLSSGGLRTRPLQPISLGELSILKKLGSGSTGTVYLARQKTPERLLALKVLAKALARRPTYLLRFYREADVLARLSHPGIVTVHGAGEDAGVHFLALEYVSGLSVAAILERTGGRLRVPDSTFLVLQCGRALAYAHGCGVVHRDIKPSNLMVSRAGEVKLTDLGLAKPADDDLALTDSGVGAGTPEYMAPEQVYDAKRASGRADIYALGGVFYQLLTGELPFQAPSPVELLRAKEEGGFPRASRVRPGVPEVLDGVLGRMLAREPAGRYATCEELVAELEGLKLAGERLSFVRPLTGEAPTRATQK